MNLSLNDDQLKTILGGAVLQAITPESRDNLIKQAVADLIVPKRDTYSSTSESPLQRAFQQAVFDVARETVKKSLAEDDKVKALVEGVIKDALVGALEKGRDDTVSRLTCNIRDWLTAERKGY